MVLLDGQLPPEAVAAPLQDSTRRGQVQALDVRFHSTLRILTVKRAVSSALVTLDPQRKSVIAALTSLGGQNL
jgi:hypothetical protein